MGRIAHIKKIKGMIKYNDIVVVKGNKVSSIAIIDRKDYINKFEEIKRVHETSRDTALDNLRKLQSFFVEILRSLNVMLNEPSKHSTSWFIWDHNICKYQILANY